MTEREQIHWALEQGYHAYLSASETFQRTAAPAGSICPYAGPMFQWAFWSGFNLAGHALCRHKLMRLREVCRRYYEHPPYVAGFATGLVLTAKEFKQVGGV